MLLNILRDSRACVKHPARTLNDCKPHLHFSAVICNNGGRLIFGHDLGTTRPSHMTRIPAAENLTIDYTPERWRLYLNGDVQERLIAEAAPGRSLRYANGFAERRRLPAGALPSAAIKQVVLGWSTNDQAWHLGLLLSADLAEQRGSRWCELARWEDPSASEFALIAETAGRGLSAALERPFRVISPGGEAPLPQPRDLPALPLKSGLWTLEHSEQYSGGLEFVRSPRWMVSRVVRVLWYTFWMVVYIVLSVATLTTELALPNSGTMLPNPAILPYLGLGAAFILLLIILKNLFDMLTKPGRITIDPEVQLVSAWRGSTIRWQLTADEIQSVYVSQVANRRGRKYTIYHGEINLQNGEKRFRNVLVQDQEEERVDPPASQVRKRQSDDDAALEDGVTALTLYNFDTDLQAAGLYIAQTLGNLPCYYDQRVQ